MILKAFIKLGYGFKLYFLFSVDFHQKPSKFIMFLNESIIYMITYIIKNLLTKNDKKTYHHQNRLEIKQNKFFWY